MDAVKFVFLFVLLVSPELTRGWRPFRIRNLNLTAYSLSDKISINASIVNVEGVSLFIYVKQRLQRLFARFEFYVDSGNGLYDLKYMNETVDMCRFLHNKKYLPLLQIVYRTFVEQGNYPTSCPIEKMLYKGENMKLDIEKLPPTLPDKNMSLAVILSSKEGTIFKPLFFYKVIVQIVNV